MPPYNSSNMDSRRQTTHDCQTDAASPRRRLETCRPAAGRSWALRVLRLVLKLSPSQAPQAPMPALSPLHLPRLRRFRPTGAAGRWHEEGESRQDHRDHRSKRGHVSRSSVPCHRPHPTKLHHADGQKACTARPCRPPTVRHRHGRELVQAWVVSGSLQT